MIYEYECPVCGVFERNIRMSESNVKYVECECGSRAERIPSASFFELKGGGWYQSGYSKGD